MSDKEENAAAAFAMVYINEVEDVAANQKIQMVPAFKLFKNGVEVAEMTGSDYEKLTALIAEHK